MKHINSFHGSISALLLSKGLDSKQVLSACNAYRGSVRADAEKTKIVSETKLTGKLTDKADGRRLTFSDKERYSSKTEKGEVPAPGLLVALSDALLKLTEVHGATVALNEFSLEIEGWLYAKREAFALPQAPAPVPAPAS